MTTSGPQLALRKVRLLLTDEKTRTYPLHSERRKKSQKIIWCKPNACTGEIRSLTVDKGPLPCSGALCWLFVRAGEQQIPRDGLTILLLLLVSPTLGNNEKTGTGSRAVDHHALSTVTFTSNITGGPDCPPDDSLLCRVRNLYGNI